METFTETSMSTKYFDSYGVVSLAFHPQSHQKSRNPEKGNLRRSADVYGLGVILLNLLSHGSTGYPSKENHDADVEARFYIDLSVATQSWFSSVQHFLSDAASWPAPKTRSTEVAQVLKKILPFVHGMSLETLVGKIAEGTGHAVSQSDSQPKSVEADSFDDEATVLMVKTKIEPPVTVSSSPSCRSPRIPISKRVFFTKNKRWILIGTLVLLDYAIIKMQQAQDRDQKREEQYHLKEELKGIQEELNALSIPILSSIYRAKNKCYQRSTRYSVIKEQRIDYNIKGKAIPSGTLWWLPKRTKDCTENLPTHYVTLNTPFVMMRSEVTQELYTKLEEKSQFILFVWNDMPCRKCILVWYHSIFPTHSIRNWKSNRATKGKGAEPEVAWDPTCHGWRLPTEAEWEYAARGGQKFSYSGSNDLDLVAWYMDNAKQKTHPVCQKNENAFELCDMSGNVFEWVWDTTGRTYDKNIIDPVFFDKSKSERGARGGCWILAEDKMDVGARFFQPANQVTDLWISFGTKYSCHQKSPSLSEDIMFFSFCATTEKDNDSKTIDNEHEDSAIADEIQVCPEAMLGFLDTEKYPMAICNDGSTPILYHRPGIEEGKDKWIIWFEGGESCVDQESCTERWQNKRSLMSTCSGVDCEDFAAPQEINKDGILSASAENNPHFYNWNHVVFNYCSSDFWLGQRNTPITFGNVDLFFRGHFITQSMMSTLLDEPLMNGYSSLSDATDIVLSGSSAGGIGMRSHLDYFKDRLSFANLNGLSDASIVPLISEDVYSVHNARAQQQLQVWEAFIDQSCQAHQPILFICVSRDFFGSKQQFTNLFVFPSRSSRFLCLSRQFRQQWWRSHRGTSRVCTWGNAEFFVAHTSRIIPRKGFVIVATERFHDPDMLDGIFLRCFWEWYQGARICTYTIKIIDKKTVIYSNKSTNMSARQILWIAVSWGDTATNLRTWVQEFGNVTQPCMHTKAL